MAVIPRPRMFAGPNGSGKSTIRSQSEIKPEWLGIDLNPDETEKEARDNGCLDFGCFKVKSSANEVTRFFLTHPLVQNAGLQDQVRKLSFSHGKLQFNEVPVNSYLAAVAPDFLRQHLLKNRVSFSFETVMPSPDKIKLLKRAQAEGFRTY